MNETQIDNEILEATLDEANEHLNILEIELVNLGIQPQNTERISQIFRSIHTIKGSSAMIGLRKISSLAHKMEDLFSLVRNGTFLPTNEIINVSLKGIDILNNLFSLVKEKDYIQDSIDTSNIISEIDNIINPKLKESHDNTLHSKIFESNSIDSKILEKEIKKIEEITEPLSDLTVHQERDNKPLTEKQEDIIPPDYSTVKNEDSFLKISVQKLDSIINWVGELHLNKNRIMNQANVLNSKLERLYKSSPDNISEVKELSQISEEMLELIDYLHLISDVLKTETMNTRLIPINRVFLKLPRLIHSLSLQTNKKVTLQISGESTELDRKIIEALDEPLLQIFKNCVDHGIESPEKRKELNKPELAVISISAKRVVNNVVISISDDGNGIDVEKIKQVVVEKQLYTRKEVDMLADYQIYNMIFLPGFTTKTEASELSGRGVGLDVVTKHISKLKGSIEVDSKRGKGSTFILKFPISIATSRVLVIRCRDEYYAISLDHIEEAIVIDEADIFYVNKKPIFRLRDTLLSILDLNEILRLDSHKKKKTLLNINYSEVDEKSKLKHIILVNVAQKRVGLIVDEWLNDEEIVIKNLGDYLITVPNVEGATIFKDGRVIISLDIYTLFKSLNLEIKEKFIV